MRPPTVEFSFDESRGIFQDKSDSVGGVAEIACGGRVGKAGVEVSRRRDRCVVRGGGGLRCCCRLSDGRTSVVIAVLLMPELFTVQRYPPLPPKPVTVGR